MSGEGRAWLTAAAVGVLGVGSAAPAFAADEGKIAVVTSNGGADSIRVIDPNGAPISTLLSRPYDTPRTAFAYAFPSWSPDAQRIAYSNPNVNMWGGVRLEPGGALTPADTTGNPAWSPKGTEIAHWAYTPQGYVIRIIKSDGSGGRTVAGAGPLPVAGGAPAWSPDGKKLAYTAGAGLRSAGILYEIPAEGGVAKVLVPIGGDGSWTHAPAYSPNGKKIAYFRERFGPPSSFRKLVVRDLATANEQPVTDVANPSDSAQTISWSPDGKRIAYPEGAPFCGVGDGSNPLGCDLVTIKVDGSEKKTILHADQYLRHPSWSRPPLPNYYVKHVEIAQTISPEFGSLPHVEPLAEDPLPLPWSMPSVEGFRIPLIAGKATLLRIYVGDSGLDPGKTEVRKVAYRVTSDSLSAPSKGQDDVAVTAEQVDPTQTDVGAALNVWLPPVSGSSVSFQVEVNPDEDEGEAECADCHPNGNRAEVTGASFDHGGRVVLIPVEMLIFKKTGTVVKPVGYGDAMWQGMTPMLPVGEANLTVANSDEHMVGVSVDDLKPKLGWLTGTYACDVLVARLEVYRLTQITPAGFGAPRWVGVSSLPPLPEVKVECSGQASDIPGASFIMTAPGAKTAVHELGHTLGLHHTLGYETVPGGGVALPYLGIGGVGYDSQLRGYVYNKLNTGDIMSYSDIGANPREVWTSPSSWQQMHEAIRSESPSVSISSGRHTVSRPGATAAARVQRRLVTGVLDGGNGVFIDSLVVPAAAPSQEGAVIGRVVARDRNGRRVASAKVRGPVETVAGERPPFVVALPASKRIAALTLLRGAGGKPLARLTASKHAPTGRFLRLPRKASARGALGVRWTARDRDRDKLSVVLLARRGKGRWQTITIGPARARAPVAPGTLGRGKRLQLRLLISDAFNTTTTTRSLGLKR